MLAEKYFRSRGPAAVVDFAWWSGLSLTDAKKGLHAVESQLEKEKIDNSVYYFKSPNNTAGITSAVFALPAFDEYLISYKNRAPLLHSNKKNISVNGIFWPVIIVNGKVAGMWSRKIINNHLHVKTEYFTKPATTIKSESLKSFDVYAKFLDKHLPVDGRVRISTA